jgi:hypothetical protein
MPACALTSQPMVWPSGAGDDVGGAARGEADQHADRPVRERAWRRLGERRGSQSRQAKAEKAASACPAR